MTKVCFDRFESLIYAREYRGFRCVNGPLCRPFFVISSRIERTIRMAHKFEINRDLVSIFKKVTKKWEIVAVEIRKKLSIAVNYTVFTFFSLFSRLNAIAMEKKKKAWHSTFSRHEFPFILQFQRISRQRIRKYGREGLQLQYNSLVKVTRGLKRWIRERMELRKYLVLIFFGRIFLEAYPGVESASNKYATKR